MFGGERVFHICFSEWWQTGREIERKHKEVRETGGGENEGLLKAGHLKR